MDSSEQKGKRPILSATCPHCGKTLKFYMPEKPGTLQFNCPAVGCGKPFGVQVTEAMIVGARSAGSKASAQAQQQSSAQAKQQSSAQAQAQSIPPTDDVQKWNSTGTADSSCMARVVVSRKRMLFVRERKEYALKLGTNVIGRADAQSPSDIEIECDTTVSRRSVSITVEQDGDGYRYWFEVLNATNPVTVCGKRCAVGDSFEIEPGADFVLGRTRLALE